jgi:hypothetical protein
MVCPNCREPMSPSSPALLVPEASTLKLARKENEEGRKATYDRLIPNDDSFTTPIGDNALPLGRSPSALQSLRSVPIA